MKYRLPEINWDLTLNDILILHMKTLDNLKIQTQIIFHENKLLFANFTFILHILYCTG